MLDRREFHVFSSRRGARRGPDCPGCSTEAWLHGTGVLQGDRDRRPRRTGWLRPRSAPEDAGLSPDHAGGCESVRRHRGEPDRQQRRQRPRQVRGDGRRHRVLRADDRGSSRLLHEGARGSRPHCCEGQRPHGSDLRFPGHECARRAVGSSQDVPRSRRAHRAARLQPSQSHGRRLSRTRGRRVEHARSRIDRRDQQAEDPARPQPRRRPHAGRGHRRVQVTDGDHAHWLSRDSSTFRATLTIAN